MRTPIPFVRAWFVTLLLASGSLGCSSTKTVAPPADPGPTPDSPANAVRRIEWTWNRLDPSALDLVTEDFVFAFAEGDSAGQPWRGSPWTRAVEVAALTRMFDTTAAVPRLRSLALVMDRTMIALPDPRPGKNPKWHRTIRSHVDLTAHLELVGALDTRIVTGNSLFFLVRGDSAAIPPELFERGVRPDSTRWWVERWEDETLSEGVALRPEPTRTFTLGMLKSLFLPALPALRR